MSLGKFQATDAWRNKFKTHLLTERKTESVPKPLTAVAVTTQTPKRLSYQLSEELQVILEEKKIPNPGSEMPRVRVRDDADDDKENMDQFQERLHAATTPSKLKRQVNFVDDTVMLNASNESLDMTNTSFETLEKMCEKTASDPNSTLFKYLDHGSPTKRQSSRPNRMTVASYDEEADALQRLLDELNVEETEKRMNALSSLADVTQLDDIEAPSRLWENTMSHETLQSISPVKMVGLMRQSTIMEEYSDVSESEVEGSSLSYESALKTGYSSESTGCYETANDTAAASDEASTRKLSTHSGCSSSSDLFQMRHSRQKFFSDSKSEEEEQYPKENPERSMHLIEFGMDNEEDPLMESQDNLIDLDTTVKSPLEDEENEPEDKSTSTCLSSESAEQAEDEEEFSLEPLKNSLDNTIQTTQSIDESLIIELSDDDSDTEQSKSVPENILNRSFTIKSDEKHLENEEEEKSLHFNDTMEEVEYMMNKGMQYMQATKDNNKNTEILSPKTLLTPVKKLERYRSPSPMLSSPITPKTVLVKPKPLSNKHALDIKPFPKLDLFKKPQGSALKVAPKSVKKQQFAHVVSPIGAYIKKTPTTPLISCVRPELAGTSPSIASTSKALRKLDCDSQIGSPRKLQQQKPQNQIRSLPKKAYISSDLKHIMDERTQFTIPGGPKIQRYLASAMVPAVVRHEGKVKIPENLRTSDMQPATSRRTDDSLADLSVASGDVSVYTIRDAQKF